MLVRRATQEDIDALMGLLVQVNRVHALGRPDLFRLGTKYTKAELADILEDDARPVFVACSNTGTVLGHGFCVMEPPLDDPLHVPHASLYIDDICVDEAARHQGVATAIYQHILDFARANGCYNVTLNVWSCNPGAEAFYKAMGMTPQKVVMEQILTQE